MVCTGGRGTGCSVDGRQPGGGPGPRTRGSRLAPGVARTGARPAFVRQSSAPDHLAARRRRLRAVLAADDAGGVGDLASWFADGPAPARVSALPALRADEGGPVSDFEPAPQV